LVLVGTPIGNLGDLSPRAAEVLGRADVVYCEDTRHSRKLFSHLGLTGVDLRSLHEHNEESRTEEVLLALSAGRTVAVISDAGMPGISDPGGRLVAALVQRDPSIPISVVPGPSAGVAGLVVSGLATDRFLFEGFLPRSGKERRMRLSALAVREETTVIFESPLRVAATLRDLLEVCGGSRQLAVVREITKIHEEVWRGDVDGALQWVGDRPLRGEVVLVVSGLPEGSGSPVVDDATLLAELAGRLSAGERTRGVVEEVAGLFGVPRRRVYDLALVWREQSGTGQRGVMREQ
jgi:16S rRNA (cytidine1402-2'-O)-methyltransferase